VVKSVADSGAAFVFGLVLVLALVVMAHRTFRRFHTDPPYCMNWTGQAGPAAGVSPSRFRIAPR